MKKILKRFIPIFLIIPMIFNMFSCTSKIVMEYNESKITDKMYEYWFTSLKAKYLYYFNDSNDDIDFWNSMYDDNQTNAEYATNSIESNIKLILVKINLFREYGLQISNDISDSVNSDIDEKIEYAGGKDKLNDILSEYGFDIDTLKSCYIAEEKCALVDEYLFGDDGVLNPTGDEIDKFYQDNYSLINFLVIYHDQRIVYEEDGSYSYDDKGNVKVVNLSDDEKVEKQNIINEVYNKALTGDNFSELIDEYSEADTNLYDHGYFISDNEVSVFGNKLVDAVKNMKPGEISKVEDEHVTYIVQKKKLISSSLWDSDDSSQLSSLSSQVAEKKKDEYYNNLLSQVNVANDFNRLSIVDVKANFSY